MIQNIGIFVSCFWLYYFFLNGSCLYIISLKYLIVLSFFVFSTDFVALVAAGWGILHEGLSAAIQSVLAFPVVVCLFGLVC